MRIAARVERARGPNASIAVKDEAGWVKGGHPAKVLELVLLQMHERCFAHGAPRPSRLHLLPIGGPAIDEEQTSIVAAPDHVAAHAPQPDFERHAAHGAVEVACEEAVGELVDHHCHARRANGQSVHWHRALVKEHVLFAVRDASPLGRVAVQRAPPVVVGKDCQLAGEDRLRHAGAHVVGAKGDDLVREHRRREEAAEVAVDDIHVAKGPVRVRLQVVLKDVPNRRLEILDLVWIERDSRHAQLGAIQLGEVADFDDFDIGWQREPRVGASEEVRRQARLAKNEKIRQRRVASGGCKPVWPADREREESLTARASLHLRLGLVRLACGARRRLHDPGHHHGNPRPASRLPLRMQANAQLRKYVRTPSVCRPHPHIVTFRRAWPFRRRQ